MKRILVFFLCILPFTANHAARTAVDSVDWAKGTVVAHGRGTAVVTEDGRPLDGHDLPSTLTKARMEAYEGAREKALLKMAGMIMKIRVDGETTLTDLINDNEVTRVRIDSIMRNRVKARHYPVDHRTSGCTLTLKISDLVPALAMMYPGRRFPRRDDSPISTVYTGLVIDARGIGAEPMILPSIYNEQGLEIYGRQYVDIRHLGRQGIVAYAHTEAEAMKSPRAGKHPYFTVALRSVNGCPVISDRDMRRVLAGRETRDNLKRCRVVFIIDRNGPNK